jgi:hypothetical protein
MFTSKKQKPLSALVLTTLPLVAVIATGFSAHAAESFKFRQSPLGSFGGDIATPADKPGFFGTASFTQLTINGIKGADGAELTKAGITDVPVGVLNSQLVPYNAVKASVAPGQVKLTQDQTQLNIVAGYLTESTYADGRIALVANIPLITLSRNLSLNYPNATFAPSGVLPNAYATSINTALQTQASDASAAATGNASGLGDTELSAVWVRHTDRLKVAAGISVFAPTGKYDVVRDSKLQANPGFGNFYTIRPGVAVTYNLNPNYSHQDWDAGVTLAGRIAYGVNTENKDTKYKSGNYIYTEAAIVKVMGDSAFGYNLFSTQQVTNDSYSGTDTTKEINGRFKTMGGGPFLSFKFPGQDAGLNFQVNRNFGGRNAIDVTSYQVRLIKAF